MSSEKPTEPAIPIPALRERQRHRPRPKKGSSVPPPSFDAGAEEFFRIGDSLPPEPVVLPITPEAPPVEGEPAPVTLPSKRRNALMRVVLSAVATSTLLCVLAVVAVVRATEQPAVAASVDAAHPSPPITPPPPEDPALGELTPPSDLEPAADTLREEARGLLAHHQLARAIELGREATKAAPEDASGWLILAAAQMEARKQSDAAESFRSCVKLATQGPVGECRSFLR